MKDATFQINPDEPTSTRQWAWRHLGLGMLITVTFLAGFLLARLLPDWPTRDHSPRIYSLVRIEPPDVFSGQETAVEQRVFDAFLQTQVQLVTSPNVLAAALASRTVFGLESIRQQPDPEAWLRDNLRIEILPGTHLMRVSATRMKPQEQATVINEVVRSYLDIAAAWASESNKYHIDRFHEYNRELTAKILNLQEQILDLEARIPNLGNESDRQRDRAKIRFLETDLRSLEEIQKTVALKVEQLNFESRGEARINLISRARVP